MCSGLLWKQTASAAVGCSKPPQTPPFPFLGLRPFFPLQCSTLLNPPPSPQPPPLLFNGIHHFSSTIGGGDDAEDAWEASKVKASKPKPSTTRGGAENITGAEAKKMMRLVNVEALKMKLGMEEKEVIDYKDLLRACESIGVARSEDEAMAFARVLDEAGVVLLFRDKVYLHPDKVTSFCWNGTTFFFF